MISRLDFHGRFRHSELAADHLVGVAQAETGENSVLPLGKFGSRSNAAGSIAEPEARRLAIEKGGGVLFVNAVVQPKGGRVMLLLCVRERVLLEHRGMAGHDGGRRKICAAVQDETKGLQRKIGRQNCRSNLGLRNAS